MSAEAAAYLCWFVAPVTSAIVFVLYLASLRGWLPPGIPVAVGVGLLLVAAWPPTFRFVLNLSSGMPLSLLGLFVFCWAGIGAPLASIFVAGRKRRPSAAWMISTFLLASIPLLVLITLPMKGSNLTDEAGAGRRKL